MVTVTPLKDATVVPTPGGGGQRGGGQLWQAGGMWLVLWRVDGALDVAPRFEGSATVVVAQTLVTMDDRGMQVEYHDGCMVAYDPIDTTDSHMEINGVDTVAAAQCGGNHGYCAQGGR